MNMNDMSKRLGQYGLIVLVHLGVVLVWHIAIKVSEIPDYVMPTPVATLMSLGEDYGWWHNTVITGMEVYGGYGLAIVVGVAMALIFNWFKPVETMLMPLMVSLNMIPKVALGPLFIVWFSYGVGSNILISFSICLLPILLTMERGLKEVDPDLIDLVRTLNASRWQIFIKIQLPGALPYLFSGMKVATVLAVAGAIVGEFIASEEGLGYLMMQVQVTMDTAAMFMGVLLITLIGVILYFFVLLLEYFVVGKTNAVN
jgi:NitT/TauT family transport system permease protein